VQKVANVLRQQSAPNKKLVLLKKRSDFLSTYKGRALRKEFFSLYYLSNKTGSLRFGISVPKTVGTAVIRNRFKRWAKAVFNSYKDSPQHLDIHIFMGSRTKKKEDFKNLKHDVYDKQMKNAIEEALIKYVR